MARTEHYERRGRAILRDLKRDDECMQNRSKCQSGLSGLAAMCAKYMHEADGLRALPQLDSFQAQRLAGLEKTIANLQGTLKNAPQKTR